MVSTPTRITAVSSTLAGTEKPPNTNAHQASPMTPNRGSVSGLTSSKGVTSSVRETDTQISQKLVESFHINMKFHPQLSYKYESTEMNLWLFSVKI